MDVMLQLKHLFKSKQIYRRNIWAVISENSPKLMSDTMPHIQETLRTSGKIPWSLQVGTSYSNIDYKNKENIWKKPEEEKNLTFRGTE